MFGILETPIFETNLVTTRCFQVNSTIIQLGSWDIGTPIFETNRDYHTWFITKLNMIQLGKFPSLKATQFTSHYSQPSSTIIQLGYQKLTSLIPTCSQPKPTYGRPNEPWSSRYPLPNSESISNQQLPLVSNNRCGVSSFMAAGWRHRPGWNPAVFFRLVSPTTL